MLTEDQYERNASLRKEIEKMTHRELSEAIINSQINYGAIEDDAWEFADSFTNDEAMRTHLRELWIVWD